MIDDISAPLGDNVREHPRKRSNIELNSSSMFCDDFTPPDPLVEGIIMHGFIYALTAPTGRGKTAVALHIAHCLGRGRKLGDLEVEKGRVLFLAGENPVDVQMRWIAMAQQLDFDRDTINVKFVTKRLKLSKSMDDLRYAIATDGGFDLIVVDSSFASFEGEDENSNAQQAVHAVRLIELCRAILRSWCFAIRPRTHRTSSRLVRRQRARWRQRC